MLIPFLFINQQLFFFFCLNLVDGMFCRTLQSLAQQKQQHSGAVNAAGVKEANLMPVPSPQQIQYYNTFEGQELTIQKQANTSLKEGNLSA